MSLPLTKTPDTVDQIWLWYWRGLISAAEMTRLQTDEMPLCYECQAARAIAKTATGYVCVDCYIKDTSDV